MCAALDRSDGKNLGCCFDFVCVAVMVFDFGGVLYFVCFFQVVFFFF